MNMHLQVNEFLAKNLTKKIALSDVLKKTWNSFINFFPHYLHACRGSKAEDGCVWTHWVMRKRKYKIEKII